MKDNYNHLSTFDARTEASLAVEKLRTAWAVALKANSRPSVPQSLPDVPPSYNREDFRLVCQYGDVAALEKLIAKGLDIQTDNNYALRWMSHHGALKMVAFLLEHGADIHAEEGAPLRWAASNGQTAIVAFLFEKGADVRDLESVDLQLTAEHEHFDTLDLLLEQGASLEKLNIGQRAAYDAYKQEQSTAAKQSVQATETLREIFKVAIWTGHVPEMVKLWGQLPEPLQAEADFQHMMAEAKLQSLKQKAKPRILLTK